MTGLSNFSWRACQKYGGGAILPPPPSGPDRLITEKQNYITYLE